MRLWGATGSHVGNVREINQDRVYFRGAVAAVADGMGGHQGGERAAELAIGEFRIVRAQLSPEELVDVVEEANRQVHHQAVDPDLRGMGTTMVALSLHPDGTMTVVNVGDSRAYWLRGDTLAQITEDHSFVEDLVRQGRLSPEEAAVHPQRNILTRALGIADNVEVDRFEIDPQIGDRLLLCSDGLFNEVTPDEITKILSDHEDPTESAKGLVAAALETPCRDNVSVAVVNVVADSHPAVVGTTGDLGIDLSATGDPSANITAKLPVIEDANVVQIGERDAGGIDTLVAEGQPHPGGQVASEQRRRPDGKYDNGQVDAEYEVNGFASSPVHESSDVDGDLGQQMADGIGGASPSGRRASADMAGSPLDYDSGLHENATTTGVIDRADLEQVRQPILAPADTVSRRRRIWPLLVLLLTAGLAAGVYFGTQRINDSSYHVQVVDGELVIFQGRAGGLLWLEPVEVEPQGRMLEDLTEASQATVAGWANFDSLKDAQLSVDNLETADVEGVEGSTGAADSDGDTDFETDVEGGTEGSTGPGSSTTDGG